MMKKILSMITLTVLMVALAGSCTKNIEERIDKTDAEVATLQAAIGQYEKLQSDITSVLQTLRAEVGTRPASEQQSVWNCINTLQNQSNAIDAALKSLRQLVGETPVSSRIDEALENLVSEYDLDSLEATLQELKEKVNAKYDVTELEKKVAQLKSKVDNLITSILKISDVEYMIQSVSIAPAYSDGSVKADENGILTFKCIVSPAEAFALESNVKDCFKITGLSVESLATKAASPFVDIPVTGVKILDKNQGAYEITADAAEAVEKISKGQSLMICLNVKTGYSDFTTDFVAVIPSVPVESVTLDKTTLEITVGGDDVKLTATVAPENATDKTVSWSSDKTDVATVDNQGNVHAVASGTATITVTTTDGGKTATCAVTVYEWDLLGTGLFTDDTVCPLYGYDPVTVPVKVYQEKTNKGLYKISDHALQICCAAFGVTEEVMRQYEGGNWRNADIILDASNPTSVKWELQDYGVCFNPDEGFIDGVTNMYQGSPYSKGTLSNGVISWSTPKGMICTINGDGYYFADLNGKQAITLPSAVTEEKVEAVKAALKSVKPMKNITLIKAGAQFNASRKARKLNATAIR